MQYRQLGNTGLIVSRLAFGAMTFTLVVKRGIKMGHSPV